MSIVRENMLKQIGYTPYCGNDKCFASWPRTTFDGTQMKCVCGWRSSFEPKFIEQYREAQAALLRVPEMTIDTQKLRRISALLSDGKFVSHTDGIVARAADHIDAQAEEIAAMHEALQVAHGHINMHALEISHCKDAAMIRAALSGEGK